MQFPAGVTVFERGWLSSNCVLFCGGEGTALVDSGYVTHAAQLLALLQRALQGGTLDLLVNTHLHSDHCGGNAALQATYPALRTQIAPGQASLVRCWDPVALSYTPTGQSCPQFRFDGVLAPGADVRLGKLLWQVHAAPGHDPHSVVLFEPQSRTLISADALWERGFGVVFPELDGLNAFDAVARTLDLIESLRPLLIIPGHGAPFGDAGVEGCKAHGLIAQSIAYARKRLDSFVSHPQRHRQYAAKVLVKFKLLECQQITWAGLLAWALATPYLGHVLQPTPDNLRALVDDLVRSGAARLDRNTIYNHGPA